MLINIVRWFGAIGIFICGTAYAYKSVGQVPSYADGQIYLEIDRVIERELWLNASSRKISRLVLDSLKKNDVGLANALASIAEQRGVPLSTESKAELGNANSLFGAAARNAQACIGGVVGTDGLSDINLACGVATDFTLIGDVRDATGELLKAASGGEPDRLVLALSCLGIALSAAAPAGGASAPADVAVSAVKTARRKGLLNDEYTRILQQELGDAIAVDDLIAESKRVFDEGGDLGRLFSEAAARYGTSDFAKTVSQFERLGDLTEKLSLCTR